MGKRKNLWVLGIAALTMVNVDFRRCGLGLDDNNAAAVYDRPRDSRAAAPIARCADAATAHTVDAGRQALEHARQRVRGPRRLDNEDLSNCLLDGRAGRRYQGSHLERARCTDRRARCRSGR